ncbi:polyol transporter 5-like [Oryza brachyantha]|uniref:Major facilitator superfamily (MFS) profile domain-containing protein n=1 Tax=Oryza brachyantha TaxID=4533 RepID=J3LL05_ORYBR|nr:polyol transporter 5-like [Oryza brachyantha]
MSKDASDEIPAAEAPAKRAPLNKYALACAVLASMNSILLGYDISVMSGAQKFMKEDLNISDTKIAILAGIINIYSLVGSLAAGRTSDWIGRRYTMVLAAVIFFAGALIMGLAPSYAILMLGRFVAGVGVGYALMIAPVYTAEVAPASARGLLTSFPEVFINTGVLLGYVSNFAFYRLPLSIGWRAMFLVGAVPPVFLALGVLAMPESPRWLVMQGRIGDARRVLEKTSDSPAEAEERLADIKNAVGIPEGISDDDEVVTIVRKSRGSHGEGVWRDLLIRPTPAVRRILIACLGLQFFQQASGIDSVVLYSPRVFDKAGLHSDSHSIGASVAVGASKTLFILVATFLLDRVGRRPLLLTSAAGMVISLVTLASALHVIDQRPEGQATPLVGLSIAMVLAFVASFSIGMGPIAWVYSSEIFPLRLRAQGCALGTAMNRIMSGAISMSFLSLCKAITFAGSFYLYAGIATAGWVFMFFFLPETRGRSLEDTIVLFGGDEHDTNAVGKEHGHGQNKSTELTT